MPAQNVARIVEVSIAPRTRKVASLLFLVCLCLLIWAQLPTRVSHAAALATSGDDWPTYLHDAVHSGASVDPTVTAANAWELTPLWTVQTGGPIAAQASVVAGTIYVGSWDGYEYALDAATGAVRWKTYLGVTTPSSTCSPNSAGVTSSATVQNGVVYVGGGDAYWYALDANTGAVLWKVYTGDNSATGGHYNWSSPLIANGYAYIGIASFGDCPLVPGQVLQVSLTTHQVVNTLNLVPSGHVGGGIWTSPAFDVMSNTIYLTTGTQANPSDSLAQAMVAVDASSLAVQSSWTVPAAQTVTDSDWGTSPLIYPDTRGWLWVAAVNKNGVLYAFHRDNIAAGPAWQQQISVGGECAVCGQGSVSSGAVGDGRIYFAGGNTTIGGVSAAGSVRAFDPATGAILWEHATASPVIPAITYDNGLIIDGAGKRFEVLDASSGAVLYSYTAGGTFYGAPSIANGVIYAGATDGKLYAFGLPSGLAVGKLSVNDTANAAAWSVQSNLQSGATQYGDRGYTLTSVPAALAGATWIRSANSSRSSTSAPLATFTISQQATVYVALDTRLAKPAWMDATWSASGLTLTNSEAAGYNTFALYAKTFSPGTVALGANSANGSASVNMYTIIIAGSASPPPPPGPVQLSNLAVADSANAAKWALQAYLQTGVYQYGDRAYILTSVPSALAGAAWIRTANGSKSFTGSPLVTFSINQQATVYVALDTRVAPPPAWIDATWTNTGLTLTNSEATGANTFALYSKTFPAGSVSLGPNTGAGSGSVNMYSVIVQ